MCYEKEIACHFLPDFGFAGSERLRSAPGEQGPLRCRPDGDAGHSDADSRAHDRTDPGPDDRADPGPDDRADPGPDPGSDSRADPGPHAGPDPGSHADADAGPGQPARDPHEPHR